MDIASKFLRKVIPEPNSGCWIWLGWINNCGYGVSYRGYKHIFAHRLSYEISNGPIPDGLEIDHRCRMRWCVNPDHLEAVTSLENQLRALQARGVIRPMHATHCVNGHDLSVVGRSDRFKCMECSRISRRKYNRAIRERTLNA